MRKTLFFGIPGIWFCHAARLVYHGFFTDASEKNPDCYELVRGKTGRIVGNLTNLLIAVKGLPLTYNRDLQEDKPPVFDSYDQLSLCLAVVKGCMEETVFNEKKCEAAASDPLLLATDLADFLVGKGLPFRQAHHVVGELVGLAESQGISLTEITDEAAKQISEFLTNDWREVFNLQRAFSMREKPGMPGPGQIASRIEHWNSILSD